jgi:choline-sulfatase
MNLNMNSTANLERDNYGKNDRLNVLIIMTDQHRHDMMTCAGNDEVPTPNIDKIAERGVRFTNAYCPYPVCLASRSSLLTGLYAHDTGAINNNDRLDWRLRTMAHHFGSNGYLTGLIGKMHFNDAHNHGFEYYMSINDWLMYLGPKVQKYADEIANHPLAPVFYHTMIDDGAGFPDVADLWDGPSPWVGNVKSYDFESMPFMASELEAEDHLDMFIARETAKFMRRYKDQPFLLIASFMKPHTPFYAPREFAKMYPIDDMELPPVGDIEQYPRHIQDRIKDTQKNADRLMRAHRAGYRANLAFVDECIGYVYEALDELDLLDNTIVIYTSDHGEMDGDHGLYQKFCLFEPSVKVPLIVSCPSHIPEGRVANALIEYIGIYPTLAELISTEVNRKAYHVDVAGSDKVMSIHSFADILYNPDLPGPDAVFSEYDLRSRICQYMIRTREHKYILNQGAQDELYDMQADPMEYVNLAHDSGKRKIIAQLREQLFTWYNPARNPYRPCDK